MLGSVETKINAENPNDFNTGVIASNDIPENAVAGPYPGEFKWGQNSVDEPKIDFIIEVKHKDGRITLDFELSNRWTRYVQPARDRHEQNMEFYKDRDGIILLRTLRKIKMGEQLYAWYSEPLARTNGVPFLSLQNIIGNQQYQCDKCNLSFRYPNPLKSHLMYKCKRQETDIFRPYKSAFSLPLEPPCISPDNGRSLSPSLPSKERFHIPTPDQLHAMNRTLSNSWIHTRHFQPNPFNLTLQNQKYDFDRRVPSSCPIQIFNHIEPKYYPFQHSSFDCSKMFYNMVPMTSRSQNEDKNQKQKGFPFDQSERNIGNHTELAVPIPSEVEGEPLDILPKALLTKCKSGHICVFCGKFYSRKYGLKIHLRTHTGYKPLKCKVCLRPFGDPSNLNKHVRLHAEGETPYRCEFCSKILVRRRDLERHIRSRHAQEITMQNSVESNLRKVITDEEEEIVVT